METTGTPTDRMVNGMDDMQDTSTGLQDTMTNTTEITNVPAMVVETVTETRMPDEMMTTEVLTTTSIANIKMIGMTIVDMDKLTGTTVKRVFTNAESMIGVPDHTRTHIDTPTMVEIEITETEMREEVLAEEVQEAVSFSIIETKMLDADLLQTMKSTTEAMQSGN